MYRLVYRAQCGQPKGEGNAVVVCKLEAPRRVEQDNGADGCLGLLGFVFTSGGR